MTPDAQTRDALAARLGLSALKKLRFRGRLHPESRRDWRLDAHLGATVTQPCAVTLAPVITRIEEDIARIYRCGLTIPEGEEAEMPDDREEPLPAELDLFAVMEEALALAVPLYPRAEGAELGVAVFARPGIEPLRDADLKPFAGLAGLKRRLEQ
ncbi:DUF177 domain-containing protein [Rhodovulum imhoffii]|nr:hypothetical protein [Rhodovulum imhoffii]